MKPGEISFEPNYSVSASQEELDQDKYIRDEKAILLLLNELN